jgi:tRNA nucleotidyltransferase (CCA-adding enzyme)
VRWDKCFSCRAQIVVHSHAGEHNIAPALLLTSFCPDDAPSASRRARDCRPAGAVRDALLGHPHLDWDLATSATPTEMRELFGRRRTIPVGVDFGTVGVLDRDGVLHEVTTFRRDVQTDGRHAVVEFGASLDEDLARRDFTINAIAYSPRRRELRDPFDGQGDLRRRLVRAVGDPEARMREDRLRALRAIRFSARFGFTIEAATLKAISESAPHLGRLSPERVKQELEKTLEQARRPARALALWKSTGAFATVIPPLASAADELIAAVDYLAAPGLPRRPQRRIARLATLFSDLPLAELQLVLEGLRFSGRDTKWIVNLVSRWHSMGPLIAAALTGAHEVSPADVRRWVAAIGRLEVGAFMRVASARWAAMHDAGGDAPTPSSAAEIRSSCVILPLTETICVARGYPLDHGSVRFFSRCSNW